MYCPRCASTAIEGQRFCKNCGMNLGVILDALEGKRGPLDFELLKRDLRELGANLRSGFEGASNALRGTASLKPPAPPEHPIPLVAPLASMTLPDLSREVERALRKVKVANSRKYSLQQATLSLFGGGALLAAWYFVLTRVAYSGLLESLERVIFLESGHRVVGIGSSLKALWILALIPLATGMAHLFNAIFLAPRKEETEPLPPPVYVPPPPPPTVEPLPAPLPAPVSIVEDQTLRLEREK